MDCQPFCYYKLKSVEISKKLKMVSVSEFKESTTVSLRQKFLRAYEDVLLTIHHLRIQVVKLYSMLLFLHCAYRII